MREVSGKSVAFVREACARCGVDYRAIAEGLSGLTGVDEPQERVDWEVFVELLDRLTDRIGGLPGIEEVGTHTVSASFAESIRVIAGAFASARTLFYAIARWFAPAAVHSLQMGFEERPEGRLQITVEVKAPHRVSLPFFHMTAGSYRAAPRLLGQPDAEVEMRIDGRKATYLVTPPPDLTIWARGKRGVKLLMGARRAVQELSRQQDELRDREEALLESRRDFRRVIDSVPTDVLIHVEGRVVYANPSWNLTLGFDPTGLLVEELVAPEARERIAPLLKTGPARSSPPPARVPVPFLRSSGQIAILEIAPSQPLLFDGQAAAVLVGDDVTARRELEAKSQLADRMASIGTIAAGVAHEINNPLTYVIDNVRRIGTELAGGAPLTSRADLVQLVDEAVSGMERVELIVRDLGTFARGDGDLIGAVDVRAVIHSTARIAEKQVRARAQLALDLEPVPPVLGVPTRLGQVVLNLVLNAAQAIVEGAPDTNRIDVSLRSGDGQVLLAVRDTGSGMPPEVRERVFEPFFTTKPIGKGTGLGLAVCHQIVTGMGGTIDIESQVGEGTTVSVRLPALAEKPVPSQPAPKSAPSSRKKILVVDDEPLVARAFQRAMRAHDVTIAIGGQEALDALRIAAYDVIVCDLMMPGVSGIELYERLPVDLKRRVVFATGGAFSPRAQQFLAEVPNQRIDKPFDVAVVEKLLGELPIEPTAAS